MVADSFLLKCFGLDNLISASAAFFNYPLIHKIPLYLSINPLSFEGSPNSSGYTAVHNLVAADLNRDSYPDLLVTYSGNGTVFDGAPSSMAPPFWSVRNWPSS